MYRDGSSSNVRPSSPSKKFFVVFIFGGDHPHVEVHVVRNSHILPPKKKKYSNPYLSPQYTPRDPFILDLVFLVSRTSLPTRGSSLLQSFFTHRILYFLRLTLLPTPLRPVCHGPREPNRGVCESRNSVSSSSSTIRRRGLHGWTNTREDHLCDRRGGRKGVLGRLVDDLKSRFFHVHTTFL